MTMLRRADRAGLAAEINGSLARRNSTATVLFHHALAERLGLGPTDHKCLDLLCERAPLTASELAVITGLTSGAITGVVARWSGRAGCAASPIPTTGASRCCARRPRRHARSSGCSTLPDAGELLEGFDAHQLAAVASS